MPHNITREAEMSLFPMTSCITGLSDGGYIREVVTAREIIDATDMFTNLGPTRIGRVLLKYGFTALGPVCEMLEQAAGNTSREPTGPGVFVETSSDSVITMHRLRSEGLADIGLERLNNPGPDKLAAEGSLLSSRVRRMGGDPVQVAHFIFDNIPDDEMIWFDQP